VAPPFRRSAQRKASANGLFADDQDRQFYRSEMKNMGMGGPALRHLKVPEEEPGELKQPKANLSLDKQILLSP
jgi:hypothetical protein